MEHTQQKRREAIASRIRTSREALEGISQGDMAERLNMERVTYTNLENGKRDLKAIEVEDVASALMVSPVWLAFGIDDPHTRRSRKNGKQS